MSRSRVKLDLGPHGKVLASVTDFDDAKAVAAGRFNVDTSNVQLFVSDGEDLWELHPSAFQDVVADNGVIVARVLEHIPPVAPPLSIASPAVTPSTSVSARTAIGKRDTPHLDTPASSTSHVTTAASTPASISRAQRGAPSSHNGRARVNSISSTSSSESSSTSDTSTSSSSSSSSASSSSSDEGRRSASIQDVTATSASVRTIIGPNGLPVSSKERWDPKTHRLMFEKLNEIIGSETIYYTRKYTEERYRIFQLLIDNYGDNGIRGNFLRGRTAAALISRVAGVLRTARERGEKIKQPFKFFFPNKKDDEVAPRSATAPIPSTSAAVNNRGRAQTNANGSRSQTQPIQANDQPRNKRKSKAQRAAAKRRAEAAAAAEVEGEAALASTSAASGTAPATSTTARNPAIATGKSNGKGKARNNAQGSTASQHTPPQIRKRNSNAAAGPTNGSASRGGNRPANGNTATSAPPRTQERQPRRAASSSRRSRSASPRPNGDAQHYMRRGDRSRDRSPHRGGDSWVRGRDESPRTFEIRCDDAEERTSWRPAGPSSLPRRPSWTDMSEQRGIDDPLFRAETRSPPPPPSSSEQTPRKGRRWGQTPSRSSPTTRRSAVERALEHLTSVGADPSSLPEDMGDQRRQARPWGGSPNRSWHRNNQEGGSDARLEEPDLRRSVARQQHHNHDRGRRVSVSDNGWPSTHMRPRTPPRAE